MRRRLRRPPGPARGSFRLRSGEHGWRGGLPTARDEGQCSGRRKKNDLRAAVRPTSRLGHHSRDGRTSRNSIREASYALRREDRRTGARRMRAAQEKSPATPDRGDAAAHVRARSDGRAAPSTRRREIRRGEWRPSTERRSARLMRATFSAATLTIMDFILTDRRDKTTRRPIRPRRRFVQNGALGYVIRVEPSEFMYSLPREFPVEGLRPTATGRPSSSD